MKVFLCEFIHSEARKYLEMNAEIISDWNKINEVDAIINRNLQITKETMDKAKNLKAIAIHGTGIDGVDMDEAKKRGIHVFSTPHQNADSVAELIVGLTLSLTRKISLAGKLIGEGREIDNAPSELKGIELRQKTFGLIGVGDIAIRAAKIMKYGFGMNVIGYSRSLTKEKAKELEIEYCSSIEEVLRSSDIVNIGVPLNNSTVNMINNEKIKLMKKTAYLINTSRGKVVDEKALYNALKNKHIAGAACDVFVTEPPTLDNPLLSLNNFVATPHIGANTDEALYRVGMAVVKGILEKV